MVLRSLQKLLSNSDLVCDIAQIDCTEYHGFLSLNMTTGQISDFKQIAIEQYLYSLSVAFSVTAYLVLNVVKNWKITSVSDNELWTESQKRIVFECLQLIPMTDIQEVMSDFQKLNKTENCIVLQMKNETKTAITSQVMDGDKDAIIVSETHLERRSCFSWE